MEASQEGHLELVRYLLEARADVNATTGTISLRKSTEKTELSKGHSAQCAQNSDFRKQILEGSIFNRFG